MIASYTQDLLYPCIMSLLFMVCFSGRHFVNPMMSQLREWCLWRASFGILNMDKCLVLPMQVATATPKCLYGDNLLPPHLCHPPCPPPSTASNVHQKKSPEKP